MSASQSQTTSRRPRVIVVGGGFGGLRVVRALRSADADVLLLDRRNHHVFQPMLYQVATAALSPATISAPLRKMFESQRNCEVLMAEVEEVDLQRQAVRLRDGVEYGYDWLVLAAGSVPNYFGNNDWKKLAPGLKDLDDAINIRRRFLLAFEQAEMEADEQSRLEALTFVIVGGGPTGVEVAGALAEIARHTLRRSFRHFDTNVARVILIDPGDNVLKAFPDALADRARRDLEKMGVEIKLGARVTAIGEHDVTLRYKADGREETLGANNVIWAAGVEASPVAQNVGRSLGGEKTHGGRIPVQPDLTLPGHPNVFVVGDAAQHVHPETGKETPGVAQGAMQMGDYAGRAIADAIRSGGDASARQPFSYLDKGSLATIGRGRAVAALPHAQASGLGAWLLWAIVHIFYLVGFRNRIAAMAEYAWMYFFWERGVRLITGENVLPKAIRPTPDPFARKGQ
ncbi:MAG: NAD(P)/FAD-dependent oxidoreductase [Acidobacteria bacterium]|nr:NAD(P)/FAD-dependent oxidoreductase [Acidobacteriota bacterium]